MDFGKVEDVSKIDFEFKRQAYLSFENQFNTDFEVFIGPPIWANKAWVGKIYPTTAKETDFLFHFAKQFNCIELNVTHYQVPTDKMIKKWKEAVTEIFKFCPKFPQEISHERLLIGCEKQTDYFTQQIRKLSPNLGTAFLQLSPTFSINQENILVNYLKNLPNDLDYSVEFRHPSWFSNDKKWQETVDMLSEMGINTVITDVAGRRDVVHLSLSTPTLVLRFVGNELHKTDFSRTNQWVEQIKKWKAKGLKKAYIFIHCGENLYAPELSNYWIAQLNSELGLKLAFAEIQPTVVQGTLF